MNYLQILLAYEFMNTAHVIPPNINSVFCIIKLRSPRITALIVAYKNDISRAQGANRHLIKILQEEKIQNNVFERLFLYAVIRLDKVSLKYGK